MRDWVKSMNFKTQGKDSLTNVLLEFFRTVY